MLLIGCSDAAKLPDLCAQLHKAYEFLHADDRSKGYIVSEKVDLKKEKEQADAAAKNKEKEAGDVPFKILCFPSPSLV